MTVFVSRIRHIFIIVIFFSHKILNSMYENIFSSYDEVILILIFHTFL